MHKKRLFHLTISVIALALCGLLLLTACVSQNKGSVFTSDYQLNVWGSNTAAGVSAAKARFVELEQKLSPSIPTSDVAKINAAEANVPVSVSEDTIFLLSLSKTIYEQTGGAYNPAIFPVVELWKFDPVQFKPENESVPSAEAIASVLPLADFDHFVLDKDAKTVTKTVSGAKLDFGAGAKGYAADVAAKIFAGNPDHLITVGGSVVVGNKQKLIGVVDPFATGSILKVLYIKQMGVSTSGSYERNFVADGVTYHHIIAKDGYPAGFGESNPKVSVTVVAGAAVVADMLSTAGMMLSEQDFSLLLAKYNASAYVIYRDRSESYLNGFESYFKE